MHNSNKTKPVVSLDRDDVVIDTGPRIVELASELMGVCIDYADIRTPSLQVIFRIDPEREFKILEEFERRHPAHTLKPVDGALDAIRRLSSHFQFIFNTARPDTLRAGDAQWDQIHLPDLEIPIVYSRSGRCPDRPTKVEVARSHGAICHVDDMPYVLELFDGSGIATLCHKAPYNDGLSWDEIEQKLMEMTTQFL